MRLSRGYQYIYYLIYKSIEEYSVPKFWSDWKAEAIMDILIFFLIIPLLLYFEIFTGKSLIPYSYYPLAIITVVVICGFNYLIFHHRDQWKNVVNKFDNSTLARRPINRLIGWAVIVLIIVNMVFSFFMLDLNARRNHTGPYSKEYIDSQKTRN